MLIAEGVTHDREDHGCGRGGTQSGEQTRAHGIQAPPLEHEDLTRGNLIGLFSMAML